jgi:thiamine biosynthesis lipoprotein
MGGRVTMTVVGGPRGLIDDLEGELARLESLWSRFLPDSELCRLNGAGGEPLEVDPATVEMIRAMQEGFVETDGAYDPTLLPVLVDVGYATSFQHADRVSTAPASSRPGGDPRDIRIEGTEVQLPLGMTLDSGGIGKGLAADLLVARAVEGGASGALIEIGGDLVAAGTGPFDGAWSVGVEHPDDTSLHLETIRISSGAVATSGTRRRSWTADGETRHHLLDPRALLPALTGLATATVIAGTGARAEVLTKAAFMPPEQGFLAWLPSRNAAGLLITTEGEIRTSANWEDYR